MAKVQQKSEKITAFGGIFFVLDRFDRILSSVIDSHLGLRMGTPAEVIHEPEHRIPAYHRHGSKFLPIHRGIAAHGRSDYTLVWLKTDRHVSNGGKIRPLKIICGF